MKKISLVLHLLLMTSISFAQNFGLDFNGSNTRVVVPDKPALNVVDGYTIEAWIYANQWKSQSWAGSIVNKDGPGPDRGFAFRAGDNGALSFVIAADNVWYDVVSQSVMNTEQWHHVAVTILNKVMTLYIDGEAVATSSYEDTISPSDLDLNIGASPGFGDRHWDGTIDEVRMWNVARTQEEIANNIDTEFNGTESNLVAYFPMNEGSGNTTTNLVDPSCVGTLTNMIQANWVDGYSRPDFDISLLPIEGIDVVNMKTRPILINTKLKNLGLQAIENVMLTVAIDGEDQFTELVTGEMASGEQLEYSFKTPVDFTESENPTLTITASHPDDQNVLNNSKSLELITQDGDIVRLFNNRVHNFGADGQSHFSNVVLPSDLSKYERLLLHIDVSCPAGGCDPWDQPAKVEAITDEGTFEIARYVTPYMKACGPWVVDVTDFKDILAGPVSFRSFVQVWGPNGWAVTIDLELVEGADPMPYYKLNELWTRDYLVYGDPDIDYNLDAVDIAVDANTEAAHIRMTISGHGQGNTDNAAEFSQKTHQFQMDGSVIDNHFLWKSDCASNPCDNQSGTWVLSRAGWCPGQEVAPYWVNTDVTAGTNVSFDYELEEYTNLLNTGYNGSSHTEPHYRLWSYFVERSSQPYKDYTNATATAISPTIIGEGMDAELTEVRFSLQNTGSTQMENLELSYFLNNVLIESQPLELLEVGESVEFAFSNVEEFTPGMEHVFYGVLSQADDETPGDNAIKFVVEGISSTDHVIAAFNDIELYPNPSPSGELTIKLNDDLLGSQLQVLSLDGKLISSQKTRNNIEQIKIEEAGYYLVKLVHPAGYSQSYPLIILD